jgi:chromosome segregation ATPase
MTKWKRIIPAIVVSVFFAIAGLATQAAEAKQTSLDSRIFEAFKKIDGRTNAHELDTNEIRKHLGKISKNIEKLNAELADVDDDDEAAAVKRRDIRGQLIENSAEYLNQAFKLVDAAARVISANLSDLAKLAKEVRKSGDPRGSVEKLKNRIRRNVSAGKSMRRAMVELRNWAHQDPKLTGRFQSLRRITLSLDGRISVDKARLVGRTSFSPVRAQHDRLAALDRTVAFL